MFHASVNSPSHLKVPEVHFSFTDFKLAFKVLIFDFFFFWKSMRCLLPNSEVGGSVGLHANYYLEKKSMSCQTMNISGPKVMQKTFLQQRESDMLPVFKNSWLHHCWISNVLSLANLNCVCFFVVLGWCHDAVLFLYFIFVIISFYRNKLNIDSKVMCSYIDSNG